MSIDEDEMMYDAAYGDYLEKLEEETIQAFTVARLGSYYEDNPDVAISAVKALEEANMLMPDHPSAALVFAAIAIEVGMKKGLIAPIVYGMIHMETAANIIVNLVMEHRALEKFKEILQHILQNQTIVEKKHAIDLLTFKRKGSLKSLWEEIRNVQSLRNKIVHNGDTVTEEDAKMAIDVAASFLYELLANVVKDLGCRVDRIP